jgi:hypothetical protein
MDERMGWMTTAVVILVVFSQGLSPLALAALAAAGIVIGLVAAARRGRS